MIAEKLYCCDIPTALEEIRAGRVLAVVDDEEHLTQCSLVMASLEPSSDVLRLMESATSGFACMAVSEAHLSQVKLPASLERDSTIGAVFQNVVRKEDPCGNLSHSASKLQVIPFTIRKGGVLRHARPAECIGDLARLVGGELYSFFSTFRANESASAAEFREFVQTHSIQVLSIARLIKYRLSGEQLVRSKPAITLRSRYGDFQFRCIESDLFDCCAVLTKGDEHDFCRHPPLARIQRLPYADGACTCAASCMESAFENTLELISRDGHGIIVFMPSMRDFLPEGVEQNIAKNYFKEDPFSTLDESCINRATSVGACAQILRHLGAKRVRIISNRPQRVRDLESFGIEIVEEIGVGRSEQRPTDC